jgi:hypothetical protein
MRYIPPPIPEAIQRKIAESRASKERNERRERYAAAAMQQLIRNGMNPGMSSDHIARMAWQMADSMLAQENQ